MSRRAHWTAMIALTVLGCGGPANELVVAESDTELGWWTVVTTDSEVRVDPTDDAPTAVRVRIPADVLFRTGSSQIEIEQRSILAEIAAEIIRRNDPVTIIGHTDNVGSDEDNHVLGADRAAAVGEVLIAEFGVPAELLVTVRTAGEACPIVDNSTASGRARNRRVELIISGQWSGCEEVAAE